MRFARECGVPDGLRVLLRSHDASAWHGFQLKVPFALIGTSGRCNIQLSDGTIGDFHAYLQVLDDRLFLCDLTENRGVLFDDYAVTADWFDLRSSFQIGRYELRIDVGDRQPKLDVIDMEVETHDEANDVRELSEGELEELNESANDVFEPAAGLILSMRTPRGQYSRVRSTRDISLVGRSKVCKFGLNSTSVSNIHCSLVRTHESVWLIDLGSRTGTRLNGQTVRQARVPDGARLQVGRCRMTIDLQRAEEMYEMDHVDRSPALIPSPTAGVDPLLWTGHGGPSEELIRDLVSDVANSQQAAFEQARAMLIELLASQERMHAQQLEASRQQNAQLLEVIRMMTGSQASPTAFIATQQPPIQTQPPQVTPGEPGTESSPSNTVTPRDAAEDHEEPQPAETLDDRDPEIHNAWVRGQLHVISENLKKEQERGVKRLLKGLVPGRSDDALK